MKQLVMMSDGSAVALITREEQSWLAVVETVLGTANVASTGTSPVGSEPKPAPTRGPKAKAQKCKACGADRATTPWPSGGALCLACNRKAAMERYRAKHPATGMRAQIARDMASDRIKKNAPHGADRVKAAMHRIQEHDDRPHDGGRVLPIITE